MFNEILSHEELAARYSLYLAPLLVLVIMYFLNKVLAVRRRS